MANKQENENSNVAEIVYVVLRYGAIVGVYKEHSDAYEVQKYYLAKGQICTLEPQPVKTHSQFFSNGK